MPLNDAIPLSALDGDLALRLCLAAALGLMLGIDRELRGAAAGLRTHGLICLAASAITVSAIALFETMQPRGGDPLRLYEGAAGFIGIIGAGLIVFNKGSVHNITTAAHLFLTAVVGIACGAAQWPLVALVAPTGLVMLSLLRLVEDKERGRPVNLSDDAKEN
jgi:putative Mg2+ transporter-C (MgtC) family protein